MEIIVKDIPPEGLDLRFDSAHDPWLRAVFQEALVDLYRQGDRGKASFKVFRTGMNVHCDGQISCDCHLTCCRCLKNFDSQLKIPLHLILAPMEMEDQEDEEEAAFLKDDVDFSYYEGNRFDLGQLVQEQVILILPMQPHCSETCKGLCQYCGKNLNEGSCECKQVLQESRLKAFKAFKT